MALAEAVLQEAAELLAKHYEIASDRARILILAAVRELEGAGL